jgi:phosphopantothenoylcysteine decarboxylase/phosphopantothenate--cysteine ligase
MANGVADNMLITTYLSAKAPVFVAPAMDLDMMAHPSTERNLNLLRSYGNHIIEAASGELASHLTGKGRMQEPEVIVSALEKFFAKKQRLIGKKVLITAGPTHELIDPVRFIGNYSTGKMGYALAEEAANRGAEVILVSGPVSIQTTNRAINVIKVTSAREMLEACESNFGNSDIAIMAAAVADYAPVEQFDKKIKREENGIECIQLKKNPDIAASLGSKKRVDQLLIGFALETDNEQANALAKMTRKNLDAIVLNSLRDKGAGFGTDTNKITFMKADGTETAFSLKAKSEVAKDIFDEIENL